MMRKGGIIIFATLLLLQSCIKNDIRRAMQYAGENRTELEKVLEHYRKSDSTDGLKLAAAEFLIKNMPGHRSLTGDYAAYCEKIDSLWTPDGKNVPLSEAEPISEYYSKDFTYQYDIDIMSADFLIKNIDMSFDLWRNSQWSKHLSFDDFCEILLPYSCAERMPIMNWKTNLKQEAASYIDHLEMSSDYRNDPKAAVIVVNNEMKRQIAGRKWLNASSIVPVYDYKTFLKAPGWTCDEFSRMCAMLMRAKGIPVVIDYTPQWPDRASSHFWCSFKGLYGKYIKFYPFESNPDRPNFPFAKYAKIFRKTYSPNAEYVRDFNKYKMYPLYDDYFFKDVTDEYMETLNLNIPLKGKYASGEDIAYIATFNNKTWVPIYWGKVRNGAARFSGMGRNITYIVLVCKDGVLVPASDPFFVDIEGNIEYFVAHNQMTVKFNIDRKFPLLKHVFSKMRFLQKGEIQASNDSLFRQFETVAMLPEWGISSGEIGVEQSRPYRYWRFRSSSKKYSCDMAELYFYEDVVGNPIERNGINGSSSAIRSMIDNDPLTYYSASIDDSKFLDLGTPMTFRKLAYIRRGDGNAIMPGDKYEIYYWDNGTWQFHGEYIPTGTSFGVEGLPAGALYYIKGLSRGVHDRIFEFDSDSGRIIWR